jgi:hypothetical protein
MMRVHAISDQDFQALKLLAATAGSGAAPIVASPPTTSAGRDEANILAYLAGVAGLPATATKSEIIARIKELIASGAIQTPPDIAHLLGANGDKLAVITRMAANGQVVRGPDGKSILDVLQLSALPMAALETLAATVPPSLPPNSRLQVDGHPGVDGSLRGIHRAGAAFNAEHAARRR